MLKLSFGRSDTSSRSRVLIRLFHCTAGICLIAISAGGMDSDFGENEDLAMDAHLRYLDGPDPDAFEPGVDPIDGQ